MRSKLIYGDVGRIRDRAGQLGKTGEYWMGRMRVVWIINSELHGCSPDLCRLRPTSVGSKWTSFDYVLAHTGVFWGPANLVASCVTELDDTLPRFMGVQWDSVWVTHGVSTKAYAWQMALGRGRIRPDCLITSWTVATRGALLARVCRVVRFISLQGWLLIQISVTPSEMGDACLMHLNIEMFIFTLCWMITVWMLMTIL
jgi:hypothetical protein